MTARRLRTFECTRRFLKFLVIGILSGILVEDLVFADSNNEQYIEPILLQQNNQYYQPQYYQQPSQLIKEIDPSRLPEYLKWHHQQEQAKQRARAPLPPSPARKSGGIMSTLYRFLVSPTSSATGGVGNQPQIREYGRPVNGPEEFVNPYAKQWESVDPRTGQLKTVQRSQTYQQPPPFSARSFTQSQLSRGKQAARGTGNEPLFLDHSDPFRPSPPKNMYDWIVHPLKPILVVKKYQYQPLILPRKDTNFYWRCKYNWGIPFGITCAVMIGNLLALAAWTYIQIQPVEIPLRPGEAAKKDWRLLLNLFKFGN